MRRPLLSDADDEEEEEEEEEENSGGDSRSRDDDCSNCWSWIVCFLIVASAAAVRFSGRSNCVPPERLKSLETALYSALNKSLRGLRVENAQLAAENADLKRQLEERRRLSASMAAPDRVIPVSLSEVKRSCGNGTGRVAVQGSVLWRNKHGRFVHRIITIGADGRLSLCKRSTTPDLEVQLSRASVWGSSRAHQLHLQPTSGSSSSKPLLIQLGSTEQLAGWTQALRQWADGVGGDGSSARSGGDGDGSDRPSESRGTLATATTVSATAAAAVNAPSTARCHQWAISQGAHALNHKADPLSEDGRRRFASACVAAAAKRGGGGEGTRPQLLQQITSLPSATQSGSRYLLFDRKFAHGLGHEALVLNLGIRIASALNLTFVFEPLLSSSERGDHAELVGMSGQLERILGLGRHVSVASYRTYAPHARSRCCL